MSEPHDAPPSVGKLLSHPSARRQVNVNTIRAPGLDTRDEREMVAALEARLPGYVPGWRPPRSGPGRAIVQVFARYLQALAVRLNQAPEKHKLAFLELLGINLLPPRPARAPVVFQLLPDSGDSRAPAGARLGASVPGREQPLIFETEQTIGLAGAALVEAITLWPGSDAYADHSAALSDGAPFTLFDPLQPTLHVLYLAHDIHLALAGRATVEIEFELAAAGSNRLETAWEYWDGKVWRGFKPFASSDALGESFDGTDGLTRSGVIRLATECAETARTAVNSVEAYWVRGRLLRRLPPDPGMELPLVDRIRVRTVMEQTACAWDVRQETAAGPPEIRGLVRDTTGAPVSSATITASFSGPMIAATAVGHPDAQGRYSFSAAANTAQTLRVSGPGLPVVERAVAVGATAVEVDFTLTRGPQPDQAIADGLPLDVSSTFYPFAQQPQVGDAFYFASDEVFSKPGATATICAVDALTPQDGTDATGATAIHPTLVWEYWNGAEWRLLPSVGDGSDNLRTTGDLTFAVPADLVRREVEGNDGLWVRARLAAGGYARRREVSYMGPDPTSGTTPPAQKVFRLSILETVPPALSGFRLGYSYRSPWTRPHHCLTYNDFRYEDHGDDVRWPGGEFAPYRPVADSTAALYLGFDRPLPADRVSLFLDIQEEAGMGDAPPLVWEYWDGGAWLVLAVEDETAHLDRPGMLSFIGPADSASLARFGTARHWLRGRRREDGPPARSRIAGLFLNATWAAQAETTRDEVLGGSTAEPDQVFFFGRTPVLEGQVIEVRELAGARAEVELPMLAEELLRQGLSEADLRAVLDRRTERVQEVWVRWRYRPDLLFSGPDDRHYTVERSRGRLLFGDDAHGKIPPAGSDNILARSYRSGGGAAGNVPARAIDQLLAPVPLAQGVINPQAAEGGADGEVIEAVSARGPHTVRHRRQALTAADYEALAREASPAVALVRALPATHPSGRPAPGWVKLIVLPQSADSRPQPSFELRRRVREFLAVRAPAAVAARIVVTGPEYLPIGVDVVVAPVDPGDAGPLGVRVRQALAGFLQPLTGGPDGEGWPYGRDVYLSDVAAMLERTPGVDYVAELSLLRDGTPQGARVAVPPDRIVAAGSLRVRVRAAERA